MNFPIGDRLVELLRESSSDAFLAAPFIKAGVLARLLESCPSQVVLTCVARWHPEEVLVGATDLEVADVIESRPNAKLLLCTDLHAKVYRVGDTAIVGSANLTNSGLGWSSPANVEFALEVAAATPAVTALETNLLQISTPATAEHRAIVLQAVEALRAAGFDRKLARSNSSSLAFLDEAIETSSWLPLCTVPEKLYSVYLGDVSRLSATAAQDAAIDLDFLHLPDDLDRTSFRALVAVRLSQHPVISDMTALIAEAPQLARNLAQRMKPVASKNGAFSDEMEAYQILKKWLLFYFPGRYRVSLTADGEVIQAGRVIGKGPSPR